MRIDTPAEVKAAAVRAINTAGHLARYETYQAVSVQLGFDYQAYFYAGNNVRDGGRQRERRTFEGRVDRAFGALSIERVIVRVSRNSRNPHTGRLSSETGYWSVPAWEQAGETLAAQQAIEAARRERWDGILGRLAVLGVSCTQSRIEGPKLDPAEWERLLTAAEAGWPVRL